MDRRTGVTSFEKAATLFPGTYDCVHWEYIPFPISYLTRSENLFHFALYIKYENNKFILYRGKNIHISKNEIARLHDNNVQLLYVHKSDKKHYVNYLETISNAILTDHDLPPLDKIFFLHFLATDILESIPLTLTIDHEMKRTQHFIACCDQVLKKDPSLSNQFFKIRTTSDFTTLKSIHAAIIGLLSGNTLTSLSTPEIHDLGTACFLMDIGKFKIPSSILNKQRSLTETEWKEIRKHPILSIQLIKPSTLLNPEILKTIEAHHENLTGNGYPFGIYDLSLKVKTAYLTDILSGLITPFKPYGKEFTIPEAFQMIQKNFKNKYDEDILNHMLSRLGLLSL